MNSIKAYQLTQLRLFALADSAMLYVMEGFMESAPQLLLQMYIILTHDTPNNVGKLKQCFDI